jgi:fructokinase
MLPAMAADGAVVVGGEALVDLVVEPSGALRAHSGGGPFNTARALGRLEQPAMFLGRMSRDRFGVRMREELAEDGVNLDAVVDTDDPTTLALAELDAAGAARYRFYSEGTSVPGLTVEDALAALPADVAVLHVGTLGLMLEPVGGALAAAAERVADRALIMVDPNIRPVLIPDRARYMSRLAGTLRHTHVVKVSEDDLEWLAPDSGPADAARGLLADGPAVALVTMGGEGALVVTAEDETMVAAPRVQVVDTIGAGDAFSGGFLAYWRMRELGTGALADRSAVAAATEFACRVAALTCARAGASPPRLSELET